MPDNEEMIRWQGYARESRTAVNSHFLTYAAAILAFQASIIVDKDVAKIDWSCAYIFSGFLAVFSFMIGSVVVLIRLLEARLIARIAKYCDLEERKAEVDSLRSKTDFLGKWTNRLIPAQVIAFTFSAILFVVWVVGSHSNKLA